MVLGKIPISISPLFWLFAFFIGWLNAGSFSASLIWVFIIFCSLLIHELGHALMGLAFQQNVKIQIAPFGGMTSREGPKLSLGKEFLIVLAGPAAGLCLCGIASLILMQNFAMPAAILYGLQVTVLINLIWTILNLVPVNPLDGGRLLSIILEAIMGFTGVKVSAIISLVIAAVITLAAFILGQIFIGVLFFFLATESFQMVRYLKVMMPQDRDHELQTLFEEAEEAYEKERETEAIEKFQQVRTQAKEGMLYMAATEELAILLSQKGEEDQAYQLLSSMKKDLSFHSLPLYHRLAYERGNYAEALRVGEESFTYLPTSNTALINALCHASLGEVEPAIGWLERALQEGVEDVQAILSKKEFDSLRDNPRFATFVQSLD